jgi:hypothetical protein
VTCDEVRTLLPEHLLGSLSSDVDLEVRRHLRACSSCRAEMASLGEGIATFATAVHDRQPPPELRDRVLTVLEDEWRDAPVVIPEPRRPRIAVLSAAAAVVLLVASIGFGLVQTHRANLAQSGADSYSKLLNVLGGEDFRVGKLTASGLHQIEGNVVLYDAHTDQSWGLLIVTAPGMSGKGFQATLWTADGKRVPFFPTQLDAQGDGSAWIVTSADLRSFTRLTFSAPDGTVLATAQIHTA